MLFPTRAHPIKLCNAHVAVASEGAAAGVSSSHHERIDEFLTSCTSLHADIISIISGKEDSTVLEQIAQAALQGIMPIW